MEINKDSFSYAITLIKDGWIFEDFAQQFLSCVIGYEFIPVGGSKDKGIDAFQHIFKQKNKEKNIFQMSTESDHKEKIDNTTQKLIDNEIEFDALFYVTNRIITNKDHIIDEYFDIHKKPLRIFDHGWFSSNCNHSDGTIRIYNIFISTHLHQFNQPGKSYIVSNLDTDTRIYVFLRQQIERQRDLNQLDVVLTDTLILFSLEGTDPDKNIFKTRKQIYSDIKNFVKFDPKILDHTLSKRLKDLTTKPRKIKYHSKEEAYCLPYDTRLEITQRNLEDINLLDVFLQQTEEKIKKYLKESETIVRDLSKLVNETINKIFYYQGLEFSNFILKGESEDAIEKKLTDVISRVVDDSSTINKNKQNVKIALTLAIRDIIYNGTVEQKKYFKSLSNTYMMMFMLHWDPQISIFFQTLASTLNIYVGTSIIIPALSEFYLSKENKRHWNLLVASQKAGITLLINDIIIDELVSHFKLIKNIYLTEYKPLEKETSGDESVDSIFITEIMIRAYYYARLRNRVDNFDDFINNFVDPDMKSLKNDLIDYLREEFGIKYISNKSIDVKIDNNEYKALLDNLKSGKSSMVKAENDSKLILTIYAIRSKNNESSNTSIFGYKTWWLSKDATTYNSVKTVFSDKYPVSCYIRPDFLYNYITLAPSKEEIDEAYKEIFPSLLGVNLSFHMPDSVNKYVRKSLLDHKGKSPARVKAIIRKLTEQLKSDPTLRTRKYVKGFLDDELGKIK